MSFTHTFACESVDSRCGHNWWWQTSANILIRSVQGALALGFPFPIQAGGFAQMFVNGWICPGQPQFDMSSQAYFVGPQPTWTNPFVNFSDAGPGQGMGKGLVPGGLFTRNAKVWAPSGNGNVEVSQIYRGILVPQGWFIAVHVDAGDTTASPIPCDVEGGLTIEWDFA